MHSIALNRGLHVLVDDDDYEWLSVYQWTASWAGQGWYAVRNTKRQGKWYGLYMHRAIMDEPVGVQVDHINRNRLDNRRANLRLATARQNHANKEKAATYGGKPVSSKHKGVYWNAQRNLWQVSIKAPDKFKFLGRFPSETDAALAYNRAAEGYYGEFAVLNRVEDHR